MTQTATVATPFPAIAELECKRQLIRAIQGGSEAMRKQQYLPKYPAESDPDYRARCQNTILDDFVTPAIDKATGKLFSKPIKVESLPTEIEVLIENIDRQGRALDPFILDVAKTAFADGISYVMADMPPADNVQTLADEKALGIRPYAIHVKPCCLLEALSEMIGGVETLVRVRIMECVQERDGEWGYVDVDQVRVWYRDEANGAVVVRWETYRQNEKKEWVLYEDGLTSFKAIYLVPFYVNRTGFMLGAPCFNDIAEKNLEHFRLKSGYWTALEMCNFAMPWATGVIKDDGTPYSVKVGPMVCHSTSEVNAKFGYMETTGIGVGLSEKAIQAVESRIESAGVNLRVENAGRVSATAAALDSEETNASLKAIANGFGDSIELLFGYFAEMMGIEAPEMEAEVCTDFGVKKGTDAGLQELTKGRALGDISREAWINNLKWRGEIDPEFDAEEDASKLESEGPPLATITTNKTDTNNITDTGDAE